MIKVFKSISRLSRKLLVLGFFFMNSYQLAWANYEFIRRDCESSHLAIKMEYIYFQPSFDNDFIAAPIIDGRIPFALQPGGPGNRNEFNYASGYRLSTFYSNSKPCNLIKNIGFRYTYLPAKHLKKVSLDSLLSSNDVDDLNQPNISGFLTADHQLKYYAGDLFINHSIFHNCRLSFSVQPSLHYAYMTYQSLLQFSEINSPNLIEKAETGGLGPKLGLKLNYQFYDWFAFKGGLQGGLLISRARTHFQITPYNEEENLNNTSDSDLETLWKVFPFWETNIGLCLSFFVQGYSMELELGYEYLTYPNFINRIQFPSNGSLTAADIIFTNFDFQGPYASVSIAF